MANSADPDQLASSGSTLFAKAVYIRVKQDKGLCVNALAGGSLFIRYYSVIT